MFFTNSRYIKNADTEINTDGTEKVLALDVNYIPQSVNDLFLSVNSAYAYRLDLISNEFYGTTRLWWAIALANGKGDITNFPEPGDTIRIPASETLQRYL